MQSSEKLALVYLTQSTKYLRVAENIFEQMVNHGNPHIISSDVNGQDDFWKNYFEKTKWSDFIVSFPALFLFYHGIELMLKGLFPLYNFSIPFGHKSDLLNKLGKIEGVDNQIIEITDKYLNVTKLSTSPLGKWLETNDISIDDLYERLRYPTDKDHVALTNDLPLKYQQEKWIPFAKQILNDSKKLREIYLAKFREIYPQS